VAQLEPRLNQLRSEGNQLTLPGIMPRKVDSDSLPLSWAQKRLWFLEQLEGTSSTYNIPGAVKLRGSVDINALQLALSAIVQRHEILRTNISTVDERAIQIIQPETNLKLNVVDLQHYEKTEQEALVREKSYVEGNTAFDLESAPLARCSLLQLAESEYVFLLTMHHIISDGWSIGIFIKELCKLYQIYASSESNSKSEPLAKLPIQYADYAMWQNQQLSGAVLETQLNYWKQQLEDAPQLLQLPTDYPRPKIQKYQGATQTFTLDWELTQKLKTLSLESGATLFMTLLSTLAILLNRYSGQSDIVVGTRFTERFIRKS